MIKFNINSICILSDFKKHKQYKEILLDLFKKEKNKEEDNFKIYGDNITNMDWSKCSDFNRTWVKLILNDLNLHFNDLAKNLNYTKVNLTNIWFQQYALNSSHGWHIHGGNYTGVYYVNFKDNFAQTELIDPIENKKIKINAKEGDIVIFPSIIVHRSPPQKSEELKTIISFNFDFEDIQKEYRNLLSAL